MASEEHLINGAARATGDEHITVAGLFEPKGMIAKTAAGAAAGSVAGDALGGDLGQAVGTGVGAGVGSAAATKGKGAIFVVAVSPDHIYVLAPAGIGAVRGEDLVLLNTFRRDRVEITVHARVSVRTLVMKDPQTAQKVELEGVRAWWKHAREVVEEITLEGHEPDESDAVADANAPG